jgi:hypothetical protein
VKKVWLALVVLASAASIASAFTFKNGPNEAKFTDADNFLRLNPATGAYAPVATGAFAKGDYDITSGVITNIYEPAGPGYGADTLAKQYFAASSPGTQLTIMVYDLAISRVIPDPSGSGFDVFVKDAGLQPGYSGGRVDVYQQTLTADPAWDPSAGPSAWSVNGPGGPDTYPTTSDGTLILSGTLVDPGINTALLPGELLEQHILSDGTGATVGNGFISILDNPNGTAFQTFTGPSGATYQVTFKNTFELGDSGWNATSNDPIDFTVVPEPATFSLLGTGLVGLVGILRRRMK